MVDSCQYPNRPAFPHKQRVLFQTKLLVGARSFLRRLRILIFADWVPHFMFRRGAASVFRQRFGIGLILKLSRGFSNSRDHAPTNSLVDFVLLHFMAFASLRIVWHTTLIRIQSLHTGAGTCLAMAQIKPASSRAIAVITTDLFLPRATI